MKYLAAALLIASPVFAESHTEALQGDAEAGMTAFNRQCISCHVVKDDAGVVIAGRKAISGPNLYAIPGGTLGTVDGYRYGKAMKAAAEAGLTWSEAAFVGYVQDPRGWLREALGDDRARAKMTFRVRKEEDAYNIYAYLVSVSPAVETEAADAEAAPETN